MRGWDRRRIYGLVSPRHRREERLVRLIVAMISAAALALLIGLLGGPPAYHTAPARPAGVEA